MFTIFSKNKLKRKSKIYKVIHSKTP